VHNRIRIASCAPYETNSRTIARGDVIDDEAEEIEDK
jgi:hypothetical protein